MANYYVKGASGTPGSGTYRGRWQNSQTWAVGDRVAPTGTVSAQWRKYIYECTTGGAGGASQPTWVNTPGSTTTSGSAVFTCRECTSWANATPCLYGLCLRAAAGDTIWISHAYNEAADSNESSLQVSGTDYGNPVKIICADDTSGEPPATLATTANVKGATNVGYGLYGDTNDNAPAYWYGIIFSGGAGATANGNGLSFGSAQGGTFEKCKFRLPATNLQSLSLPKNARFVDCWFKFGHSSQIFAWEGFGNLPIHFEGGGFESGTATPASLVANSIGLGAIFTGFDFSNLSDLVVIPTNVSYSYENRWTFRNCKMPSGWGGGSTSQLYDTFSLDYHNCDSGDTNYRIRHYELAGSVVEETTLVRTGGASDGTTALAWKLASSSFCGFLSELKSLEIMKWNESVGSSVTVTVEVLHDSATNLTDKELWLDVFAMNTSGLPVASVVSGRCGILTTPSDVATSSETWTTTGMSNPNKQKVSVTFTPQEKGFLVARVALGKASKTIYVDPVLTIA